MGVSPTLPLFERREELARQFGEARRNWMFNMRNLTIFPNLQIAENASSQLRIIRPIAPDRTEMLTYCVAPIGESAAARRQRIRHEFAPLLVARTLHLDVVVVIQGGDGGGLHR